MPDGEARIDSKANDARRTVDSGLRGVLGSSYDSSGLRESLQAEMGQDDSLEVCVHAYVSM